MREMSVCFFEGRARRRRNLQLRLQHFCHNAVAKPLLGRQKEFLVDAAHRMARLRVKQKVFLFHAERVHAASMPNAYMPRYNRPDGTFVPSIVDAKAAAEPRGRRLHVETKATESSARRLAAARGIYLFSQRFEANRADHNIVADHIAWRAAKTERLGKL